MKKFGRFVCLSLAAISLPFSALAGNQLEYVAATTDNVLLDTGIVPSSRGTVEVKFLYLNGNNNGAIWCARGYKDTGSWNVNTFSALCHSGGFRFDYNNSNGSAVTTVPISTTTPQIARLEAGTGTIDGTPIRTESPANYTVGGPLCLFGTYRWRGDKTGTERYGDIGTCMIGRIYYCRVYDADGNLTNEFVPFRSSKGEVGMIDIVGNPSLDESKFKAPVQGVLEAGPDACPHENVVDGICQDCEEDLYASTFGFFEKTRENGTLTLSGGLVSFGAVATNISATCKLGEGDQDLSVALATNLTEAGDFSFALPIDSNKNYRFELTLVNDAPIPRTNLFSGFSFPPEELSSEFLNRLANSDARILSSPYATGGDIILQDGDDYIHVYYSTNGTQKFLARQTMMARVLAVGGGGAGGLAGGGGGAGGMLDLPTVPFLESVPYAIHVGAGGVWPKEWANASDGKVTRDSGTKMWGTASPSRFSGRDSSISNETTTIVMAHGGGGGGSCGNKGGLAGGSGGGGAYGSAGGLPIDGQGNNGGSAAGSTNGSAGGGGAGSPGSDTGSKDVNGSNGGSGAPNDILGFEQYFGGGGGGGCQPSWKNGGNGGLGGGGSKPGDYAQNTAQSGTDGLGGGGAGSGGQPGNVWAFLPGNGGNGIVVIRYTDPEKGGSAPLVSLDAVTPNQNGTASFCGSLIALGTCRIFAVWGEDSDHLALTNSIAEPVDPGTFSRTLNGLLPGRTYYLSLFAKDDKDQSSEMTTTLSFTMPENGMIPTNPPNQIPIISSVTVKDATGGDYVLLDVTLSQAGSGYDFSDCTATARWGTQNQLSLMTESTNLMVHADGTVTLRPTSLSPISYYGCVEVVNPAGYLDRVLISFSTADTATYRWNPAVYEGDWRDRANWTTDEGRPWGLGYPGEGATADLTSTDYATIYVSGIIRCKQFMKEKAYAEYVLVGTTDDAAIHSTLTGSQGGLPTAQIMTLDHIAVDFISGGTYTIGGGAQLLLQNGAKAISKRTNDGIGMAWELQGSNARIELIGGSTLSYSTSGVILSGNETELIADEESRILPDAGGVANGGLVLSNGARVELASSTISSSTRAELAKKAGTDPATIVMSGSKPSLVASRILYAEFADVNFRLLMPTGGWTTARISGGTDGQARPFGVSEKGVGNRIVLTVPKTAPIRDVKTYSTRESPIVSWKAGIDLTKVAFGGTAKPDDYFYFTSTNDEKYVFCPTNSALVSTVDLPLVPVETVPTMTGIWYHHATHAAGSIVFLR